MAERAQQLHAKNVEFLKSIADDDQQIENRYDNQGPDLREHESVSSHTMKVKLPAVSGTSKVRPTPSCPSPESSSQKKRKRDIALGEIDPNFGSGSGQNSKRAKHPPSSSPSKSPFQTAPSRPSSFNGPQLCPLSGMNPLPARSTHQSASTGSERAPDPVVKSKRQHSAGHAVAPQAKSKKSRPLPIERSLNIKPLAAFRGYPRRNDTYDVFVVIHSVGDSVIKRARMPPKRDIRIVDPSTEKKVLLSVFVEPENFIPAVGTIALIRSVTTHEWDGGMLNVYPKQCEGRDWFLQDPMGVEGCDVEFMRRWWTRMQARETEEPAEH